MRPVKFIFAIISSREIQNLLTLDDIFLIKVYATGTDFRATCGSKHVSSEHAVEFMTTSLAQKNDNSTAPFLGKIQQ